ncbi:MAG TPA: glycine cleavage T C-terminal barrel domain-containing protein [Candidatus Krumholzibacteria bacterium]|nr:glycine cleavage T C-terminal barrel domain-containing protein [Candidatus Krumholzibacteria bacterium]
MLHETYIAEQIPLSSAFGVEYPDAFSHPRIEYEMLTHTAGLIDLSHWGVLRLTGADRVRFLNAMVTNDVAALKTGQSCAALMTTTKGKIVADLLVLARADELLVLVMQGPVTRVAAALESHIIADDVVLTDVSADYGILSSEGPKSRELVWRVFPREPLPLKPGEFTENDYQGITAIVVRHSVVGDKGLHVIIEREHFARMREYLVQGGIGIDCGLVGGVAWNARRIENGLPWFGSDVTEDNFPAESRLEDHVNYEKGCYLGQETIARMHYRGHPNWQLVALSVAGDAPCTPAYQERWEEIVGLPTLKRDPDAARADVRAMSAPANAAGTELSPTGGADRKAAGRITSGALSPQLKRPIFLGMVRAAVAAPGSTFEATLGGKPVTLTVIELPVKGV